MLAGMDEHAPAAPVSTPVHYVNARGQCCAAVVNRVDPESSNRDLRILDPGQLGDRLATPYSARPGTNISWHGVDLNSNPGCLLQS
jgi:hypothetical protein